MPDALGFLVLVSLFQGFILAIARCQRYIWQNMVTGGLGIVLGVMRAQCYYSNMLNRVKGQPLK